jgi:hypothetical protein
MVGRCVRRSRRCHGDGPPRKRKKAEAKVSDEVVRSDNDGKARRASAMNAFVSPDATLKIESESDSESDATEKDESISIESVGKLLRDVFHSDNAKVIAALDALSLNLDEDEKKCEVINAAGGCFALVKLLEDCLEKATEKFPHPACAQVTELIEAEELNTLHHSLRVISCLAAGHYESKVGISSVGGVKALVEAMKTFPRCVDLQVVASCALGNLTYCDLGTKKAVKAGAMVVLVAAANNHLNIACICEHVCWILSNIIDESKEHTKLLIRLDGATTAIKVTEKWPAHMDVQTKVQSLIKSIATEMNSWLSDKE